MELDMVSVTCWLDIQGKLSSKQLDVWVSVIETVELDNGNVLAYKGWGPQELEAAIWEVERGEEWDGSEVETKEGQRRHL